MIDLLNGDFNVSVLDVVQTGDGQPVAADPRKEYATAGTPFSSTLDEIRREGIGSGPLGWHGIAEYQRMYHTPAIGSSFNALRAAVLSGPVGLLPAIKPQSALAQEGQVDGSAVEADMAAEIAESNRRTLDAWETPANLVLWEGMEAMFLGHMLGERKMDDVRGGPDDGLLAITRFRWLPRSSYRFRVDPAMNVQRIGVRVFKPDNTSTWEDMDPEHFGWLTWDSYRNDPRGRSVFRMAYEAWRMLIRLLPEFEKGLHQFGTPWIWGTTAPNAGNQMVPPIDRNGVPIAGKAPITQQAAMVLAMNAMRAGSAAAGPNGSTLELIESAKDVTMMTAAISIFEGWMIRSILLQLRATVEAKHGSKADGEVAQDIMGTLVRFVRIWLERWLRSLLMGQNRLNYGDDIARRLTPLVTLGEQEHQDFAANSSGVGLLYQAGYFTSGQLTFVDTFLGLPQREPGDPRVGPTGIIPDTPPIDPNAVVDPNAPVDPNAAPAPADANAAPAQGGAA